MKYMIESTDNGCVETIELGDGSKYVKRYERTDYGSTCKDKDFAGQMEVDGICEEMFEKVYDVFDGFLASDFMDIADLDG